MKQSLMKKLIFGLLLAVWLFPLFFQNFSGTITFPLKGYQVKARKVDFNRKHVLDGQWQNYAEAYTKDNLQTRHFLIRLNNQLKYSLFDHLNAKNVERGKNDFYFERHYAQSYLGVTYNGEKILSEKIKTISELRDTLAQRGIETLVVLAAGKGQYMPENLPPRCDTIPKKTNDYEVFSQMLQEANIPSLDLQQYLLSMKDTTSYPLFTKGNIHWSFYAISYVTDTLLQTLEKQLDQDLPDYERAPVRLSYRPHYYTEKGIFGSLNLYWTTLADTFAYRDIKTESIDYEGKYRPKVWVVGDSFYGTLVTYDVPQYFFDENTTFFYYNGAIVNHLENKQYAPGKIKDYLSQLEEQDIVILWTTDAGIEGFDWGASDMILEHYRQSDNSE
ncbi:MAG: hypothetical protein AAFP77_04120 [Bacteroidota bacterium]